MTFLELLPIALGVLLLGIGLTHVLSGENKHADLEIRPSDVLYTVSGTIVDYEVRPNRPGTVLVMSNGTDTGRYYVEKAVHYCKTDHPVGERVKLLVSSAAVPVDGVRDAKIHS